MQDKKLIERINAETAKRNKRKPFAIGASVLAIVVIATITSIMIQSSNQEKQIAQSEQEAQEIKKGYRVIKVDYISQVQPIYAPVGCEATSLLMGLHAKGYAKEIGLKQFLDDLPKTASNPAKGFVGSPYKADKEKKTRTTIYPKPLVKWAKKYGKVYDISGSSTLELKKELLAGNPMVVYATKWWEEPIYLNYDIEGEKQRLLSNNHAILVCGYNGKKNEYYIADPYNLYDKEKEYRYWIDGKTFERIYNLRKQAVVVR